MNSNHQHSNGSKSETKDNKKNVLTIIKRYPQILNVLKDRITKQMCSAKCPVKEHHNEDIDRINLGVLTQFPSIIDLFSQGGSSNMKSNCFPSEMNALLLLVDYRVLRIDHFQQRLPLSAKVIKMLH
ncbi:hypothetical protein LOAG_03514 [Loa loa]|uniref:Uncharacterized protein n=1 Tax=Loa loa TaxID=7209 RepID=A0A1S0U3Z4_LOALO|nr:hypothetical protein LOAG_03514 [Loa loa]EFO24969.1 hypothetical protein LOAG_03514 [Loa loa]